MAKLILKSIAYYPQALAELPMSHKDLGLIDTDKPYKKLIIPTQKQHLYRLVDMQTGQVLKAQKLIRDHNDLKVYVGDVIVVELKDFFSFQNATTVKADEEPLYMVDAGEATCIANVNDTPTGSVTITGHLKQGTVLQAANTLDDLDGMGVVSYQWQVSSDNSDWKDMVGATDSSFTLTQAQTGKYVRVKASYTDGFGQAETVYNDISSNTTVLDVMEAPVLRVTPSAATAPTA